MLTIDGNDDGEERSRECDICKEIRENYDK